MSALLPAGSLAQTPAQATAPAAGDKNILAWAAKPAALMPYTPPNRLVYRLADILAAHKGKQSWAQIGGALPRFHRPVDFHGAGRKNQDGFLCR